MTDAIPAMPIPDPVPHSPPATPTTAPVSAPASAPTTAPASAPTTAPASAPTTAPASAPTTAPASAPATVPVSAPYTVCAQTIRRLNFRGFSQFSRMLKSPILYYIYTLYITYNISVVHPRKYRNREERLACSTASESLVTQ